jgi:hypothetical protein
MHGREVCSVEATNPVLHVLNLYKVSPNDSYDKNQKTPPTRAAHTRLGGMMWFVLHARVGR